MAPIGLVLATVLLAFGGVHAAKDKVRISQWVSNDCSGHTSTKQYEIKLGECRELRAQSFKVHKPKRDKDLHKWLDPVNKGEQVCWITAYRGSGCMAEPGDPPLFNQSVPASFESCLNPSERKNGFNGVRSIKFHCEPIGVFERAMTTTAVIPATSWAIGPNGTASGQYFHFTTTIVESGRLKDSIFIDPSTNAPSTASATVHSSIIHRAADDADKKYEQTHVWLKHPFALSTVCYECWLTKKHSLDKFECESSDWDHPINACGPRQTLSSTITAPTPRPTTTDEVDARVTTTMTVDTFQLAERGSPKTSVRLTNPFNGKAVCAKAKWKHAGKRKQKVVLKGPRGCGDRPVEIDAPNPTIRTTTTPATSTITIPSYISTVTYTATEFHYGVSEIVIVPPKVSTQTTSVPGTFSVSVSTSTTISPSQSG